VSDPMLPVGSNRCRCAGCGRYFTTVGNFDRHQKMRDDGTPECLDPSERGLILNDGGYWQLPASEIPVFTSAKRAGRTEGVEVVSNTTNGDSNEKRKVLL